MTSQDLIARGRQAADELATIIRQLSDQEVTELLGHGVLDDLLKAILNPTEVKDYPNIVEFLLANKHRASLLALVRYAITHNYSFKGTNERGETGFVSPMHEQFYNDGVTFLEGPKPFEGLVGLYKGGGRLSYAVAARDIRPGENMGADDLKFLDMDDFAKLQSQIPSIQSSRLDEPLNSLADLLRDKDNDESKYQDLLQSYPWILGAQYRKVQRHQNLDDENIPDFTGVRVHDDDRDIFELKPPFMKVFTKGGDFSSEFNNAWNQAERYLNFVREEKDYLRRKGLRFDTPICYLILGYDLPVKHIEKLRIKQRMNPSIQLRTYDDLIVWMRSTIKLIKLLKSDEQASKSNQYS